MYYIINNTTETLSIFDDDKTRFDKTLEFLPELKNERVLTTNIVTAVELREHPNKCIVDDIEIDIEVTDYETVTREDKIEVLEWTTETRTGTRIIIDPETGEPVIDPQTGEPETEEYTYTVEVPVMEEYTDPQTGEVYERQKFHIETITVEEQVPVGTHTETITVKGLVLNPNYAQEEAAAERQRLDALMLTPSDVERALYYGLGMDFDDLKQLISTQAPTIDLKGLAIEFRANNFYRGAVDVNGNRIIDMVGAILGFTPQDMDYLFTHKQLPNKNS